MDSEYTVICPVCKKQAPWVENKEVYGRNYGKSYMCYYCKDCDTYVGCHQNTRRPLGSMATKELRDLRKQVHAKIDPYWISGKYRRGMLYKAISRQLGYQYHTGESDKDTCRNILAMDIDLVIKYHTQTPPEGSHAS